MLTKAFINQHGQIELPGPFFEKLKKQDIKMLFTQDLITGITNILPLIQNYELKTYKNDLRIKYTEVPDGIKEAIDKSPNWKHDVSKKVISFTMENPEAKTTKTEKVKKEVSKKTEAKPKK